MGFFSQISRKRIISSALYFLLVVIVISFFGACFWLYHHKDETRYLIGLVTIEGVFLTIISLLYYLQFRKIQSVNAEKDAALKLLESRLAAIEAAADGIGIVDPQGRLTYMNHALKAMHALTEAEASSYIGKPWIELYNPEGKDELNNHVLPHVEKHLHWRGTTILARKDGKKIHAEMSLQRLPDGSLIGTARDISAQVKADQERQELEQKFYQAQKMEAIGRLAGGMAHDFNNVLSAIRGNAEFLEDDLAKTPKEQVFAKNILSACVQAKDLIDQILAFSRQKQGGEDAINMMSSIEEALSLLKASLPRTIVLESVFRQDDAYVQGNSTQISQVLMNICVNARDAIEDDHGAITIVLDQKTAQDFPGYHFVRDELPPKEDITNILIEDKGAKKSQLLLGSIAKDQDYISIRISDTGSGISRSVMERIFEPFFTTKPVNKGTGLGLSTALGVMASHQGALILESEIGKGTDFELLFPKVDGTSANVNSGIMDMNTEMSGTVLLVEDQMDVQSMMIEMLERFGFDVDACDDGQEALMVLTDYPDKYDLIVTDQNMPKMSGLEMVEEVYKNNKDIPFLMISGYSIERMQDLIKEHPAIKAVLRKPVSKKDLREKIALILSERTSAQAELDD